MMHWEEHNLLSVVFLAKMPELNLIRWKKVTKIQSRCIVQNNWLG